MKTNFQRQNEQVQMSISNDFLKTETTIDGVKYFVEVLVDELTLKKHKVEPNQALAKGISLSRKAQIGESNLFDKNFKAVFTINKRKLEDGNYYVAVTNISKVDFINESGLNEKL